MLNGRGFSYERNNVNIVLTEKEAAAVANSVELDLCGYLEPEAEALLSSALEKFAGAPCTAIQTITCHGRDDYAVWNVEIPSDMFRSIVREAAEKVGTLEELMDSMDATTGCEMRLLTQMKDGRFAFFSIPERMNGLRDYETQAVPPVGARNRSWRISSQIGNLLKNRRTSWNADPLTSLFIRTDRPTGAPEAGKPQLGLRFPG